MNDKIQETRIKFGCTDCGKRAASSRIPVSRVIDKLDACFAVDDMDGAGKLLEYWEHEAVSLGDMSGELSVVNELLGYYRKVGNAERGLRAVSRSLELLQLLHQEKETAGATVMLNAATTMKAFGKSPEALPLYETVGEVYRKNLPENDSRFAGFYNNKALALVDTARYAEAEDCYRRAMAVLATADTVQPDSAVTYVNMAHLYEVWLPDAEQAVNKCLEQAEDVLNHPEIKRDSYYAFVCNKCAPSYDYFGFFMIAKDLRERAKRIYEGT